ncbi:unannotated protein [freshwater metagenome]|uniref:Unannotated protein n=1 Tax=freshwater metagenome TaxID=449393 RepID=A0A6J7JBM1_9ZZZZ|nr:hypothetical protein [Actinomycetota bacterium]
MQQRPVDTRALLVEARQVLDELAELDRLRRRKIDRLRELGFRSRSTVGEYGELIASAYYGAPLAPASTQGYDLVNRDGRRVSVKTLRSTPENRRTRIPAVHEPYDLLFALRIDEDFVPEEALEIPRSSIAPEYGGRAFTWSRRLLALPGVRRIDEHQLAALISPRR